jgi:hypothetical protein
MKMRTLLAAGALVLVAPTAFAQSWLPQTDIYGNPLTTDKYGLPLNPGGAGTQVRTPDGRTYDCTLPSQNQTMGQCSAGWVIRRDGNGGYVISR